MSISCIILMYHIVDEPLNPREQRLCCHPEMFRAQMKHLSDAGYHIIQLSELAGFIKGSRTWPEKAIVITFDDGMSCTYEKAFPIMQEYGHTASVFVISDLVGKYNEWLHDKGFPKRAMLTSSQVLELSNEGIDIGSHTLSHCKLGEVPADRANIEIHDSKKKLEDMLGLEVPHFAYPFGSYNKYARDAVEKSGYRVACSTLPGRNKADADMFLLKRVEIRGQDTMLQFRMKLLFATHDIPPYSIARNVVRKGLEKIGLMSPKASNRI